MKHVTVAWIVVVAVITLPRALAAHHSLVQFDTSTPVWLKGTVVRFDRVNPHSRILVEQTKPDGHTERWAVEGPAPNALARLGIGEDSLLAWDLRYATMKSGPADTVQLSRATNRPMSFQEIWNQPEYSG